MEIAILAGGCFWGMEDLMRKIPGVEKTRVGYTGGHLKNPTYKDVCTETTGHAEAIEIFFDPSRVSYRELLEYFFQIHDPTTLNSQGPDFGTQYRSEIFYLNDQQKNIAEKMIEQENVRLSGKVVTKTSLVKNYCPAEEYHQRYLEKR